MIRDEYTVLRALSGKRNLMLLREPSLLDTSFQICEMYSWKFNSGSSTTPKLLTVFGEGYFLITEARISCCIKKLDIKFKAALQKP